MNATPYLEDAVSSDIQVHKQPFVAPGNRMVRALIVAVIVIACACLTRMAMGNHRPVSTSFRQALGTRSRCQRRPRVLPHNAKYHGQLR